MLRRPIIHDFSLKMASPRLPVRARAHAVRAHAVRACACKDQKVPKGQQAPWQNRLFENALRQTAGIGAGIRHLNTFSGNKPQPQFL